MALAELLERLERRTDTPDTSCNPSEVSAKPAPILDCTPDTPDTPRNSDGNWEARNSNPMDKRIGNVVATLANDSGLRYALDTHTEADPNTVILTVAIRNKAACELRIPKSRYDAIALLELIEKHTMQETLQ